MTDKVGAAYAAYIGLDWGDEEHSVCLQATGSCHIERHTLKQSPEHLHDWLLKLRDRFGGQTVAIAIEQSRGAVIHALLGYDFVHVFRINPKALARYREAFSPSGAKDDPTDAEYLLRFVLLHRDKIKPWVPDDPQSRALRRLVEFRRETVSERVRLTNQLTQLLKEYFPQALAWAGDLDSAMACDFLERWPNLRKIQKSKPEQIRRFYQQHRCRRPELIEDRINQIRSAKPLTEDPAVLETSVLMVHTIVPQLRHIIEAIERLDREIAELFRHHPDYEIFSSFPGAGDALAPRLQAAFGSDRERFESADDVQKYSGIAPVTERSGKTVRIHHRFACSKFIKQTFHEFAGHSVPHCAWAGAFYNIQRQRGKEHHAAVRSLAYKWIRILYRCWKDRVPYQDVIYMDSLRKHGAALVRA